MEGGEEITINIIMVCITIVLIITICKHGEEQVVGEKEEEEERDLWRGVDSSRGRRWAVEHSEHDHDEHDYDRDFDMHMIMMMMVRRWRRRR